MKSRISLPFVLLLFVTACATGTRVELKSEPSGAEVYTLAGERFGQTPLVIEGTQLEKVSQNGRLEVKIIHPGYVSREIQFDIHGNDSHTVTLEAHNEQYFNQWIMRSFAPQFNVVVRELLAIQGLLILKKLDQAQNALEKFQKDYPNVAAGYVMMSNVAALKGNKQSAREYLLRAQSIDPDDPVVLRMLSRKGAVQ